MPDEPLHRLAGVAAVIAGVLRVAAAFTGGVVTGEAAEVLYAVIDIAAVFGILGFYLRHRSRLGGLGIFGFAVALVGAASIVGPDGVMYGVELYMAGSAVLLLGLAILGGSMLRGRLPQRGGAVHRGVWPGDAQPGAGGARRGERHGLRPGHGRRWCAAPPRAVRSMSAMQCCFGSRV
jgi:hypothetical protein